ncbi:signal peptide peptidase SppA [soil metagenome]
MKQFLITIAGVFVALLLFFIGVPIVLVGILAASAKPAVTPSNAVLALDLRGGLSDQEASNPFAGLTGGSANSVMSVVETLKRAQGDSRIKGLMIRLPETGMEPAAAEELRGAFLRFRASGKPVYAHSQGLYSSGVITATYMLGAAADQLWMQPGAPFEATGLASEEIFFKRAFDKYGVKAEFEQREQYKNAVNGYLYDDYTPAHREAQKGWMTAVYERTLANAAADRKLKPEVLKMAIEAGPYDAAQAASNGLIDRIGQVHEAEAAIEKKADAKRMVQFADYAADQPTSLGSGPTIAVITAEGAIMTGSGGSISPLGGDSVSSDQIAKAFYDAAEDKDVKAIVFRVSSPGGSDTASEQIAAALRAAKAAGKPVVVSMGTYAASGGYWISADASKIVAQPTTLTGSIGVYGGKFAVGETAARYGVDLRSVSVGGDYAGANSLGDGFTQSQRAAYAAQIDRVYARFIAHVAEGRKMTPEQVRDIAHGRVWTGAEAKGLGLVDQLGGFPDAVEVAKTLAGVKGEVRLKMLPARLSAFEALQAAFGVSADSARTLAAAGWVLGDPKAKAAMDEIFEARLRARGAVTLTPKVFH